jgi:hypothetical protein
MVLTVRPVIVIEFQIKGLNGHFLLLREFVQDWRPC